MWKELADGGRGLTTCCSRRRHTRLLGEVLGVVVVLVGWQSLSAAEHAAVRRTCNREKGLSHYE
jgi:hypothetical protein